MAAQSELDGMRVDHERANDSNESRKNGLWRINQRKKKKTENRKQTSEQDEEEMKKKNRNKTKTAHTVNHMKIRSV